MLPYNVVRIGFYVKLRSGEGLETTVHQIRRNFYLMESFLCLFLANSFINPLLYALKMPEFKRALFYYCVVDLTQSRFRFFLLMTFKVVRSHLVNW